MTVQFWGLPSRDGITSARVERLGGHEHVGIWVGGAKAGELVFDAGAGLAFCRDQLGLWEEGTDVDAARRDLLRPAWRERLERIAESVEACEPASARADMRWLLQLIAQLSHDFARATEPRRTRTLADITAEVFARAREREPVPRMSESPEAVPGEALSQHARAANVDAHMTIMAAALGQTVRAMRDAGQLTRSEAEQLLAGASRGLEMTTTAALLRFMRHAGKPDPEPGAPATLAEELHSAIVRAASDGKFCCNVERCRSSLCPACSALGFVLDEIFEVGGSYERDDLLCALEDAASELRRSKP